MKPSTRDGLVTISGALPKQTDPFGLAIARAIGNGTTAAIEAEKMIEEGLVSREQGKKVYIQHVPAPSQTPT